MIQTNEQIKSVKKNSLISTHEANGKLANSYLANWEPLDLL